jgi:hypothetical protein
MYSCEMVHASTVEHKIRPSHKVQERQITQH